MLPTDRCMHACYRAMAWQCSIRDMRICIVYLQLVSSVAQAFQAQEDTRGQGRFSIFRDMRGQQ